MNAKNNPYVIYKRSYKVIELTPISKEEGVLEVEEQDDKIIEAEEEDEV